MQVMDEFRNHLMTYTDEYRARLNRKPGEYQSNLLASHYDIRVLNAVKPPERSLWDRDESEEAVRRLWLQFDKAPNLGNLERNLLTVGAFLSGATFEEVMKVHASLDWIQTLWDREVVTVMALFLQKESRAQEAFVARSFGQRVVPSNRA